MPSGVRVATFYDVTGIPHGQNLSISYRGVFLRHLDEAFHAGKLEFFHELKELSAPTAWKHYLRAQRRREWVVYAKRPFGGPQHVLDYFRSSGMPRQKSISLILVTRQKNSWVSSGSGSLPRE